MSRLAFQGTDSESTHDSSRFPGIDSNRLTTQAKNIWLWVDSWFNSESYPCLHSSLLLPQLSLPLPQHWTAGWKEEFLRIKREVLAVCVSRERCQLFVLVCVVHFYPNFLLHLRYVIGISPLPSLYNLTVAGRRTATPIYPSKCYSYPEAHVAIT